MTGIVHTPEQVMEQAAWLVMNAACTKAPLCVIVEAVWHDENGGSAVIRKIAGPMHGVLGQSTDPQSLLDVEKLQELAFPETVSNSDGSESDDDGDEEEEDAA